ncbi:MAG TPA: hypothetical protein VKG63_08630 [Steroidobacteraceae bacterium]|nr:hypothetical protein [Steroidobacteraceae bacterium]
MRLLSVAAAVCLCLLAMFGALAGAPPAQPADTPPVSEPSGVKPLTPTPPSGDAAAKHAKRTACLKDAKAKKLVGAEKTSFLQKCIAAP